MTISYFNGFNIVRFFCNYNSIQKKVVETLGREEKKKVTVGGGDLKISYYLSFLKNSQTNSFSQSFENSEESGELHIRFPIFDA